MKPPTPGRSELLHRLAGYGRDHDAGLADRLDRLRNVEPETGAMMAVLIRGCGAQRILELGTSNGYSTVWLGDAALATGGHVLSVDVDPVRTAMALETIERAGLTHTVELRTEDAAGTLTGAPDASVDFIFLDAERSAYVGYWPDLVRVLSSPGLLVVDNAISHAAELAAFSALVQQDARVTDSRVPIGAGVLLVSRAGSGSDVEQ